MDRQAKRSSTAPKLVLEPVRQNSSLDSFPLASGRYLIGSAPDCDLVIAVSGVAPQHCLMIVGVNKTIVKAISPLTWINDGPLTEAVLKHGERLILGPVELRTRCPEVSEWVEIRDEDPVNLPAPVTYQPPQIEELLDHARQQLQTAIDESPSAAASWSEDLPLSEAVQIHAAAAIKDVVPPAVIPADQAPSLESTAAARREFEQRSIEIEERSRAIEYLGSELATREDQLRARERVLNSHEAQLKAALAEVERHQQSLTMQEQALQVRSQAETTASRLLAERSLALEDEQARVQQLEDAATQLASEVQREASVLAEQRRTLATLEAELASRDEALQQQSQRIQALVAVPPVDTREIQIREATVAKRETVLSSSLAALQVSRDQISKEAAQLEGRFAELLEREQAIQFRQSGLTEQATKADALLREATTRQASVEEREQAIVATLAAVTEREAALQRLKSELIERDQQLNNLRSELDIRDEALNQQFSQLQLDRSTLRAGQSKLQLAEQTANQRLADLDWSSQQRATELETELNRRRQELESLSAEWEAKAAPMQEQAALLVTRQQELVLREQQIAERELSMEESSRQLAGREQALAESHQALERDREQFESSSQAEAEFSAELTRQQASLDQDRTEYLLERQTLERLRSQLEEQRTQLDQEKSERANTLIAVADRTEIDKEWQSLSAERAELASERREFEEAAASLQPERQNSSEPDLDSNPVGDHLQALVTERDSLAQVRNELLQEQKELRAEREEVRQVRTQLQQDRDQLVSIQTDSASERDTYLLERQEVISERQRLQDRDRQIKIAETEIGHLRVEAEQLREDAASGLKQMTTQRVHLDEEWASLRAERVEHIRAQTELDAQREELTSLAQQLSDVGTNGDFFVATSVETAPLDLVSAKSPVLEIEPQATVDADIEIIPDPTAVSDTPTSEVTPDDEKADPLAGFASFSSIGAEADDELPPEIAAIIRQAGGQSVPTVNVASNKPQADRVLPTPPPTPVTEPVQSAADRKEESRLRDLLGRASESFVHTEAYTEDEVAAGVDEESDDLLTRYPSAWKGDLNDVIHEDPQDLIDEADGLSSVAPERNETPDSPNFAQDVRGSRSDAVPEPEDNSKSTELRSRLSEMFGIDLGSLRQASPQPIEESVPADIEFNDSQAALSDTGELDTADDSSSEIDTPVNQVEEELAEDPPAQAGEALDPVAAYMEQLLARTRKSKDGNHSRSEPIASKAAPKPNATVVQKPQPVPQIVEAPESTPARTNRKMEQAEKEAIRANLDSFRSIANTQARSDVARSELGRLSLASQIKQIFLGISSGIAVLMLSTELWTTRRYRLEIAAALIATAYLGYDFWKTRIRLRELESIASNDAESSDDLAAEQTESEEVVV